MTQRKNTKDNELTLDDLRTIESILIDEENTCLDRATTCAHEYRDMMWEMVERRRGLMKRVRCAIRNMEREN